MLLKTQRNDIFNTLAKYNLQPVEFLEDNRTETYRLKAKDSALWFSIAEEGPDNRISAFPAILYNPGADILGINWSRVMFYFKKWAAIAAEENETPDLWADAQANAKLFASNGMAPDEMFNNTELRQLESQVRLLSQQLSALQLPAHAQKLLTAIVEEIPKKATRLTKEEVRGWFMSAIVTQVTNLALSPEHVAAIGHLLKTTFMGMLQLH